MYRFYRSSKSDDRKFNAKWNRKYWKSFGINHKPMLVMVDGVRLMSCWKCAKKESNMQAERRWSKQIPHRKAMRLTFTLRIKGDY